MSLPISIESLEGFDAEVALTAEAPEGISVTFLPAKVTPTWIAAAQVKDHWNLLRPELAEPQPVDLIEGQQAANVVDVDLYLVTPLEVEIRYGVAVAGAGDDGPLVGHGRRGGDAGQDQEQDDRLNSAHRHLPAVARPVCGRRSRCG